MRIKIEIEINNEKELENAYRHIKKLIASTQPSQEVAPVQTGESVNGKPASAKAKQYLLDLLEKQGKSRAEALEWIKKQTGKHIDHLTQSECSQLIKQLGGGKE